MVPLGESRLSDLASLQNDLTPVPLPPFSPFPEWAYYVTLGAFVNFEVRYLVNGPLNALKSASEISRRELRVLNAISSSRACTIETLCTRLQVRPSCPDGSHATMEKDRYGDVLSLSSAPLREEPSSFSARVPRYPTILVQLHDRSNDWYAAYRVRAKATSCLSVPDVDNEMLYIAGEIPACMCTYA